MPRSMVTLRLRTRTPRLRSALWHEDEIDAAVKLGEHESIATFTLPIPSPSTATRL